MMKFDKCFKFGKHFGNFTMKFSVDCKKKYDA